MQIYKHVLQTARY